MAQPKTTHADLRKAVSRLNSIVSRLSKKQGKNVTGGSHIGAQKAGIPAPSSGIHEIPEGLLACSLDPVEHSVSLTRQEIFDRAMDLTMQHGFPVEGWVNSIQRAIKEVNKARPELGQ